MSRILAVDPGDARLGIAISDPSCIIARPLDVLVHRSRQLDAARILELAQVHDAATVVVGIPYDQDGQVGPQARKALRLVTALREISQIQITTWDESGSTRAALQENQRENNLDARAAAVILQEYLDAQSI
jgi:putative Holliday junction resolvase